MVGSARGSNTDPGPPVRVACAANGRYAVPLAVMLGSVDANLGAGRALEVYVVDDGLDRADKRRLSDSLSSRVAIHWLPPERSSFDGLPLWGRMPVTTYDKIMIAEALPAGVERVIWLDVDLLVLGDIGRLWDRDLDGRHVLAVTDPLVRTVSSPYGIAGYPELGIPRGAPYFNVGVMVIDVGRWRDSRVSDRAVAYLKRHRDRVFFLDQEALNAVLAGSWGELDARWNWSVGYERVSPPAAGARPDPWILHFTGNVKPWTHARGDGRDGLWFDYLDRTAWSGWRPTRSWRDVALWVYEFTRLRKAVHPAERWGMRLVRWLTRTSTTRPSR